MSSYSADLGRKRLLNEGDQLFAYFVIIRPSEPIITELRKESQHISFKTFYMANKGSNISRTD